MSVTRVSLLGTLINAYLVREDDGLTLVDTLMPRCAGRIRKAAGELGAPIVRIVLTHAHQDHIGSLDALAGGPKSGAPGGVADGVEVLISPRDARLLAKDLTLDPGEPGKLRGGYSGAQTKPTGLLHPGDRVGSLEVHASPGHTPGHVSLLDVRDRTLISGDAYSTLGGVETTARTNPRFPLPALATWHRPTALASAQELRKLDPARLAPGHGRTVEAPGSAMDAAIQRAAASTPESASLPRR